MLVGIEYGYKPTDCILNNGSQSNIFKTYLAEKIFSTTQIKLIFNTHNVYNGIKN